MPLWIWKFKFYIFVPIITLYSDKIKISAFGSNVNFNYPDQSNYEDFAGDMTDFGLNPGGGFKPGFEGEDRSGRERQFQGREFDGNVFSKFRSGGVICTLCLVVDREFIKTYGQGNEQIVSTKIERLVEKMSWVFRSMDFNDDQFPENIGFNIKRFESNWNPFPGETFSEYIRPKPAMTLLSIFATNDFSSCCLGVGFTMRTFMEKQVGITFVASPTLLGGICDYRIPSPSSRMLNTNVILITGKGLEGFPLSSIDFEQVLLHELGHAFGVGQHDNLHYQSQGQGKSQSQSQNQRHRLNPLQIQRQLRNQNSKWNWHPPENSYLNENNYFAVPVPHNPNMYSKHLGSRYQRSLNAFQLSRNDVENSFMAENLNLKLDLDFRECSGYDRIHVENPTLPDSYFVNYEPPGGRFIMWSQNQQGKRKLKWNNLQFSPCSKRLIRKMLEGGRGICFVEEENKPFCGNGILESGEECDCGSELNCKILNCCGSRKSSKPCIKFHADQKSNSYGSASQIRIKGIGNCETPFTYSISRAEGLDLGFGVGVEGKAIAGAADAKVEHETAMVTAGSEIQLKFPGQLKIFVLSLYIFMITYATLY